MHSLGVHWWEEGVWIFFLFFLSECLCSLGVHWWETGWDLSGEDDLCSEDGRGGGGQHVSLLGWKCLKCNSATRYKIIYATKANCHQGLATKANKDCATKASQYRQQYATIKATKATQSKLTVTWVG